MNERILLVINVRWWNAEAHYAVNLAWGLAKAGCPVWVAANPGSPAAEKAKALGLEVVEDLLLNSGNLWQQWRNWKRLHQLIRDHGITLIHSFKPQGALLFALARKGHPRLLHVRTRGEARKPKQHWFNQLLYGAWGADGLIAAGGQVLHWLLQMNLNCPLLEVHHYAMPVPEPTPALPNPLNLPPGAKLVTLLGRTQPVKGHLHLLQAFVLWNDPQAHLLFLIKDLAEFPETMTQIEEFSRQHQLQDRLHLLGFQQDLQSYFKATDVGVIPSLGSEVNCRAAVEFMARGVPLIAYPTGSLPEVITDGKTGWVTANHDPQELAAALAQAFSNRERLQDMGQAALLDFHRRFTLTRLVGRTLDFYAQARLLAGKQLA